MTARKTNQQPDSGQPSVTRRTVWMLLAGGWLFMLASLMSFDPADPPSHAAAPWNDPVANWCGTFGAHAAYYTYLVFGMGVWIMLAALAGYLALASMGRMVTQPVIRAVGFVLMALAFSGMQGLVIPSAGPLPSVAGGLIAVFAVGELQLRFHDLGAFLCLFAIFGVGSIVAVDYLVLALPKLTWRGVCATARLKDVRIPRPTMPRLRFGLPGFGSLSSRELRGDGPSARTIRHRRLRRDGLSINPDAGGVGATDPFNPDEHEVDQDAEQEEGLIEPATQPRRKLSREELAAKIAKLPVRMAGRSHTIARDDEIPREENFEGYKFPPLSLLEDPETNFSARMEKFVRDQAQVLEESLQTYGIDGEVVGIDSGPVVTLYAVQLAPGTKVSKVTSVSSDVARSLRAQNIRIVPNMAGKTTIGIEVPNLHKEKVRLKELMSGGHADGMGLPMFLGKDASGEPLVADLSQMPHMLIAGTTGSGKSVCMNSIIMSWLYTKRPDELKLVLVDPKMVELSQFQTIPHLMCPVVTENGKAVAILEWAVTKMEERYELLSEATVRDIAGYNALSEEELYERFQPENDVERAKIPKKLPYMVFIVDELADMIMTHKEVEQSVVRIAQKARAVGIHLILATQRPQANVVTGLIKSNMPCRVSFKVASGMDSRIVLDQKGAELLLGQGDMLFLAPHTANVRRAQGTLVTDPEIRKVSRFLRDVAEPTYERSLVSIRSIREEEGEEFDLNERDPLFDEAVRIMIESGRGSVSLLQRRLAIGYSRASRLVDQMGLAGILGEHRGSVARDVLITLEEWEEMKRLEEQAERDGTLYAGDDNDEDAPEEGEDDNVPVVESFIEDDIDEEVETS